MNTLFFLTLLALSVLPTVFCADDSQGTVTLIFQSHFDDAENPLRASVEVDRQNNVKGTSVDVTGNVLGSKPPQVIDIDGNKVLSFQSGRLGAEGAFQPGTGAGVLTYSPFRLDHNTVWDQNAEPVEDNGLLFSFRARFTQHLTLDDGGDAIWQVVYSFPTKEDQRNLVIAVRSRGSSDELGVFVGADPTIFQQADPESATPPLATFKVPSFYSSPEEFKSFVVFVPMPERIEHPTIKLSFRATPGDFVDSATPEKIQSYLSGVFEEIIGVSVTYPGIYNIEDDEEVTFREIDFTYPTTGFPVGDYTYTVELKSGYGDFFARTFVANIADSIAAGLPFFYAQTGVTRALGEDEAHYSEDEQLFTLVETRARVPNEIHRDDIVFWYDGDKIQLSDEFYSDSLELRSHVLSFNTPVGLDDSWYDAGTTTIRREDQDQCREETDQTPAARIKYHTQVASALYFYDDLQVDYGYKYVTVADPIGLGGLDSCVLQYVQRLVPYYLAAGSRFIPNTDSTSTIKRQLVDGIEEFDGPVLVIGGYATDWNDGPSDFYGVLQNVDLDDLKIFTTAGDFGGSAKDETFLRTLVECGDGELDPTEICDANDPSCNTDCSCPLNSIPIAPYGCTFCGNGIIDNDEVCDHAIDSNCAKDCSGCSESNMIFNAAAGICTLCGNGVLDISAGEHCDFASDANCAADCTACINGRLPVGDKKGTCFLCGNGRLDVGEVCDVGITTHLCASDCSGCLFPYVSDLEGGCTLCGNGKIDDGEVCDHALTSCNAHCDGCDEDHVAANGGGCTRCGNGHLDAGEVCDAFSSDCSDDCSACHNGLVPSEDSIGSCTLCGNGRLDDGEMCDSDPQCVECKDCKFPYMLTAGGSCLLCGNGHLDAGEVCDASHPGCLSACQACEEGYEARTDMETNPTGLCFSLTCEEAATDDSSECTCDN